MDYDEEEVWALERKHLREHFWPESLRRKVEARARDTQAWRDLEAEWEQAEEARLRESERLMNQYGIEH